MEKIYLKSQASKSIIVLFKKIHKKVDFQKSTNNRIIFQMLLSIEARFVSYVKLHPVKMRDRFQDLH